MSPKLAVAMAGLAMVTIAGLVCVGSRSSVPEPVPPPQSLASADDSEQVARLAGQIDTVERQLLAMKSELAARRAEAATANAPQAAQEQVPADKQAARADDEERFRDYVVCVAQAFANEKVDSAWAAQTSSRVATALSDDDSLRQRHPRSRMWLADMSRQIEDDGSGRLNQRLPLFALSVVDVLPNIDAELVDQGNGGSAMVLYMSTPPPPPRPQKR